ncbi:hypothetical protein A2160_05850 [Candidatus Beckwithbacteria bacterium RBG_13_42_9]|uniref:Lactamase n=1 Tax=Candidatus Beckwithbacteria bacterium RBG_13_42_9 TaxID=1797457 RepID=A0A1F5E570_9BACT|nr:MAG: hypothetical protein A2160_05850 [Candidatus Beckwithbacteria bacterium RBG_13_42_9]
MQINYLGHSSFRIKTKTATLVTDPYSPEVGFKMPKVTADIVTVSHQHFDHNYTEGVAPSQEGGKPFLITGPGEYEIKEVSIHGVSLYHDNQKGEENGKTTAFVITAEEMVLCHLGDLGHTLTTRQQEIIGEIDVLFIPVGGGKSLDAGKAAEVVNQLEPKIVVPMHYKTPDHAPRFAKLAEVDAFLKEMGTAKKELDKLILSKSELEEKEMEVVVLENKV